MQGRLERRTYTPNLLIDDLGFLASNLPGIASVMRGSGIDRAFRERIMTVVTAVNGCPYCAWFHARLAVSSGISQEEISNLLRLQFQLDVPDSEQAGLLYAQHYAETGQRPDPAMTKELFDCYGDSTARDILLTIRVITLGNRLGNTMDAFLSRLRGRGARDGCAILELLLFLIASPFMLPAMLVTKQQGRRNVIDRGTSDGPILPG